MSSNTINIKHNDECQVHGAPSRGANRALLYMLLASLLLITWHVWVYGPTTRQGGNPGAVPRPFPLLLGSELWDLLFNSHGILAELGDILPYFLVGIFLAGYIRTYKIAVKLQSLFRRHGLASVVLASLVGMITPLCACGTLTTAVSLLFAGMPLAPVIALLVTSPLMSPTTYLLTLNDLGPEWTVIRAAAAFLMGVFSGVMTLLLRDRGFQTNSIFIEGSIPRGDFHDESYPDERLRCNCKEKFGNRVAARTDSKFVIFLAKSSEMLWMVGKYVLVGVTVGSIVERYMPYDWIYGLFGRKNAFSIIWITLGSVPIFLHQISASSILYHIKSSLHGTLDGGAALAFMIGGPVTAMPTMVMFWTIFKKRVFALYLFVCIAGTILIAFMFRLIVFVPYVDAANPLLRDVSSVSGGSAAILHKQDRNVRIVMDPDNRSMIATYTNDFESEGGVVFDSGFGRILDGSADKYDNRQYIRNVAEWLEQNSRSRVTKRILVYDTFFRSGLDKTNLSRTATADLQKMGFTLRITDRRETPTISDRLLADYSQVWVVLGESGPGPCFGDAELEAIARFTGSGNSMFVIAGKHQEGANDLAAANKLSGRYGVQFSGFAEHADRLAASTASHFLTRTSDVLRRILHLVHKA
jgi:uncharacterized membrane protein YraQ (UPF0718 family)